jgi:transposase-like protein
MIKWKCVVCNAEMQTEVRPELGQRLCKPCAVRHYQRLVDIYRPEGGFRLEEAKMLLKAARKEAKA